MVTSGEGEGGKDNIRIKDEEVQTIMYKINYREFSGQWLRLGVFTAMGPGSIRFQETKIPQAIECGKKKLEGYIVQHRKYSQYFTIIIMEYNL